MYSSIHGTLSAPGDINKAFIVVIITSSLVANSFGRLLPAFDDVDTDNGQSRVRRANGDNMTTAAPSWEVGRGTTTNLEEIFLGRCYDCEYCSDDQKGVHNCSNLWDAFSLSFIYQEPCNNDPEDFNDYTDMAFIPLAADQTLFYSGTYSIALAVGRQSSDFTNIELTMLGRLVNGITFCGQTDAPGINYEECPRFDSCVNNRDTQGAFWRKSSQHFAGQASGDVTVILDGSREDMAYRNTSFFRTEEVANLDPSKVTSLTAYVVHNLDGQVTEECITGSLLELQADIAGKGIRFECIDDPSITRHVQCVQEPGHDLCRPYTDSASKNFVTPSILIVVFQLLSILSVIR